MSIFSYYSNYKQFLQTTFISILINPNCHPIFNESHFQGSLFLITFDVSFNNNKMKVESEIQYSSISAPQAFLSQGRPSYVQNECKLPWQEPRFERKWQKKSAQSVNSPQYKELKKYIHMPYRKLDHMGLNNYYFPVYVTFKVKNITEFDFESLSAKINGALIISLRVDYKDYFSPNLENNDQERVRAALEKIFHFQFQAKDNKQEQKPNQNRNDSKRDESDNSILKQENAQEDLNLSLKKYLYVQFNRDDPLRLPCKRIFEGQIKQDVKPQQKKEPQINLLNISKLLKEDIIEVRQHIRQNIKLQPIKQSTSQKQKNQKVKPVEYVVWTIRKQFTIALSQGTIWEDLIAPFNLLNFKLTMGFQDIDVILNNGEHVKFKFNCMKRVGNESIQQRKHIFQQLRFTNDGTLGQYDLAQTGLDVNCEKYIEKNFDEDISSKYQSFKYITFTIPFYKYPIIDSLTIFIPLVLITVLTLFTFIQGPDFNDKIGNIATLMIVYVGLIPAISDALPPTTSITLIDIVVYSQLTISILCLIRGNYIMEYTPTDFADYRIWKDPLFQISVAISLIAAFILIFLLIYFWIKKAYYYNLEEEDLDEIHNRHSQWVSPHMYSNARNIMTAVSKTLKLKGQTKKREQEEKEKKYREKTKESVD